MFAMQKVMRAAPSALLNVGVLAPVAEAFGLQVRSVRMKTEADSRDWFIVITMTAESVRKLTVVTDLWFWVRDECLWTVEFFWDKLGSVVLWNQLNESAGGLVVFARMGRCSFSSALCAVR
jgi:hypothetical protein